MLTIAKLGVGQESYYLSKVASGVEDYYSGEGEAAGAWLGRGAGRLGLDGEVDGGDLRSLLAGMTVDGDQRLVGQPGHRRVPGWDLTFSAPKSVSVLWALAHGDVAREVVAAHEAAVRAGLEYLEQHATASRRRVDTRIEPVRGEGLVVAAFRHRTSRAGDPQLHTHALAVNAVERIDGGWGALHSPVIYRHARTAGFVYQALLRSELTERLGISWTPIINGYAEIDGVDQRLQRLFSKRRADIVDALGEREHSLAATSAAARRTRTAKAPSATVNELRDRWADEAAEAGIDPVSVLQRAHKVAMSVPAANQAEITDALLAPTGLTMSQSTFERRDLMRAWCESLPPGTPVDLPALEARCDRFLRGDDVVAVAASDSVGGVVDASGQRVTTRPREGRWTTTQLLELEHELLVTVAGGTNVGAGRVAVAVVDEVLADRSDLSGEQAAMVRHLTTSGNGVDVVVGQAGTGKTYALAAAADLWRAAGLQPIGVALAARAASELQDGTGIPSSTVAQFLLDAPGGLSPNHVVVVDEAAMVDTRRLARLVSLAAGVGAKVALVGDHHQLPAVETGGAFAAMVDRLDPVELHENRRQRERWERETLAQLRVGATGPAGAGAVVAAYRARGRLHEATTPADAKTAMVRDWDQSRRSGAAVVMVASRRDDVDELNAMARALLVAEGAVAEGGIVAGGRQFAAGDRVVCLRNDRSVGVHNGLFADVVDVDPEERSAVLAVDGCRIQVPAPYLEAGQLAHAYATTIHKAQGATVDHTLLLGSDDLYKQAAYVGLSRGRDRNDLYVSAELEVDDEQHGATEAEGSATRLARALVRDRAKQLAVVQVQHQDRDEARAAPLAALWAELDRISSIEAVGGLDPAMSVRRIDLVQALEARIEAAGRAAEITRPPHIVEVLGAPPTEAGGRERWRAAAGAIESHRARFPFDSNPSPPGQAETNWQEVQRLADASAESATASWDLE
jgi:conjugative relaxase-like TrwC/TraI family protein